MSCNVYLPDNLLLSPRGDLKQYVVGHLDGIGNFVVITTVPKESTPKQLLSAGVMDIDKIKLSVIGTVNFEQESLLYFNTDTDNGLPAVRSGNFKFVNLIIFKSPNSLHMEFYSLNSVLIKELSLNPLSDKLEFHLNGGFEMLKGKENFADLLFVINSIDYFKYKLCHLDKGENKSRTTSDIQKWVLNPIVSLFIFMCQWLSYLLNIECLPNTSLTKVSSLFYQLDIRLLLIMRIPGQINKVKQKTASLQMKPSLPNYGAALEYIKFYNLIYVMLIDLILGNAIRNIIYDNSDIILTWLHTITFKYLFTDLNNLIKWLMDNPAGFKLNSELSNFMGELYIWALQFWYRQVMNKLQLLKHEWLLQLVLQLSKVFGATIILSSACDVISFLLFHITCFSLSMTKIYNWQLNVLRSLFRLFYGKKYNVLRKRIDSQSYDFDQLLLGIILFTVLVYLLPTITAFYLTFVVLRLGFYLVSFYLQMAILFLNELPIFIILLSLKNPKRLSDGLTLDFISASDEQIVVQMKSKSLSLFKLLDYYWKLVNLNVEIVSFWKILINVLSGETLPKVNYQQIYKNFETI